MEIFRDHLWSNEFVKAYLQNTYHHLVFDNSEEDMPVTHDIVLEWLPKFDSSMIIYDQDGGFRKFLGADPISAYRLKDQCRTTIRFQNLFSSSPDLTELALKLSHFIVSDFKSEDRLSSVTVPGVTDVGNSTTVNLSEEQVDAEAGSRNAFPLIVKREKFFPEMLDWVTEQVRNLTVDKRVPMEEIVILSPYLPDALRFSIQMNLEKVGIQVRSHRPSRPLGDEPATQCLLTLAKIAFPELGFIPARSDVAQAFYLAIEDLDLIRANLLTEIVYRTLNHKPVLTSFDLIQGDAQERITYVVGQRYEILRKWLTEIGTNPISVGEGRNMRDEGLDYFYTRLFGEILSQPGFGFHTTLDHGVITANLIQSIRNFRQSMKSESQVRRESVSIDTAEMEETFLAREYLLMVEDGLLASQYIPGWQARHEQGVLISPAFSFIMSNIPVDYQIWLDIGSRGWYERLDQPLTHPYVLSRNWKKGNAWTEFDEISVGEAQLSNLVWGLVRRCRKAVFVGLSKYDDQGFETSGLLLQAVVAVSVDRAKMMY